MSTPAATRTSAKGPASDATDVHAFATDTAAKPATDDDTASIRSRHTLKTIGGKRSDSSISIRFDDDDDDDDDNNQPWRAQRAGGASGGPVATPVLNAQERKRLLLRAGGQLLILFVVCLVGLGGTLWLALPVIDEADRPAFKIPRSLEQLKDLNRVLQHYKSENFAQVMLCWFIVYIFLQAFSIPGSMYMSILAGALWGVPIALPLSVASGATICYLISKFLGVVLVALPSWKARIDTWKDKLAQHNDNMLSYLIVIRMMPLPPHNVVNILAPHLGIGVGLFWVSTFCGIFAVTVIHTTLGEKLDEMTSAEDFHLFSLRNVLLLGGVCVAVLVPVVVRKMNSSEALEETEDRTTQGPVHLGDEVDDQDELPASMGGRGRSLIGLSRHDARYSDEDEDENSDDELPPIRIEGVEEQDAHFSAWRDPTHGSRIGEDGFREGDPSPMFADRSATVHSGTAAPAAGSMGDRVRSWWTKGQ